MNTKGGDSTSGSVRSLSSRMDVRLRFDAASWLVSLAVVLVSDVLFFGSLGRRVYPTTLDIDWRFAPPAYLIISLVLSSIHVEPGHSPALCGALVGFAIYGVFNSTELAIRSDWRNSAAPYVDVAYGTVLCSVGMEVVHRLR